MKTIQFLKYLIFNNILSEIQALASHKVAQINSIVVSWYMEVMHDRYWFIFYNGYKSSFLNDQILVS